MLPCTFVAVEHWTNVCIDVGAADSQHVTVSVSVAFRGELTFASKIQEIVISGALVDVVL